MSTITNQSWQLSIYDGRGLVYSTTIEGPIELGRQQRWEQDPYQEVDTPLGRRLIIARFDEDSISREHARLEPSGSQTLSVKNLSTKLPIQLPDGEQVAAQTTRELELPARLAIGRLVVQVEPGTAGPRLAGLDQPTMVPGSIRLADTRVRRIALDAPSGHDAEAMLHWLQTLLGVLQSAATTRDFFHQAAEAAVSLIGLDASAVLLREATGWRVVSATAAPGHTTTHLREPSRHVLKSVERERRTFWQEPSPEQLTASLMAIEAVVAAPILDSKGEVMGVLYADRRRGPMDRGAGGITRVEAMLVELLATGVAAGLARLEQEETALEARVKLRQFFTPELSAHLENDDDMLQPREVEVTVLVADVRGFSRISEHVGPARTLEWIHDILGVLSDCVLEYGGVLVDYVGDQVLAMWGAPAEQPDHAARACHAACAMLARLPELSARWEPIVGEPTIVGIGINTGRAQVGNVGSERKFKYGPLGGTVNVASRVQGVTKYLKRELIVTRPTRDAVGEAFIARRLCSVRLVNIDEPSDIFELAPADDAAFAAVAIKYEAALADFETGQLRRSARVLGELLTEQPADGPSLVLMSRAITALVEEPTPFDPVWEAPGK
ncbi:MAG: hypothetical protein K2Y37_07660 [Pirellulales bacterium]|nr:hypothetical protein [Pirellulales bacterium]